MLSISPALNGNSSEVPPSIVRLGLMYKIGIKETKKN